MDHIKALADPVLEVLHILAHIDGRGAWQSFAVIVGLKNLCNSNIHIVLVIFFVQDDVKGIVADLIALLELGAHVAGAVSAEDDFVCHKSKTSQ